MNYRQMRNSLEKMANENHVDCTKALISFEKGINDKTLWISFIQIIWKMIV